MALILIGKIKIFLIYKGTLLSISLLPISCIFAILLKGCKNITFMYNNLPAKKHLQLSERASRHYLNALPYEKP